MITINYKQRVHLDSIKDFSNLALKQGSSRPLGYYQVFSKRIKDKLFEVPSHIKEYRKHLSEEQLNNVAMLEYIVKLTIDKGIKSNKSYTEIRCEVYRKIDEFAELVGKSKIDEFNDSNYLKLVC